MATEEAVVRARIAALKTLLDSQDRQTAPRVPQRHTSLAHAPHQQRHARHTFHAPPRHRSLNTPAFRPPRKPRNLTWKPSESASPSSLNQSMTSSTVALTVPVPSAPATSISQKRPLSTTTLSLDDGTYRKMGRGFKLRREDAPPKSAIEVSAAIATTRQLQTQPSAAAPPPLPVHTPSSLPTQPPPRSLQHPRPLVPPPRTELCLFYIKHGECKHKHDCLFVHDSRTKSICRPFLRDACPHDASTCKLSHCPDQHKMPDCAMFLKGLCSREGCHYRHVNHEFTKGVAGGRKLSGPPPPTALVHNEDVAANDAAREPSSLSLRPTIRFTPKVI
ncbi:hypothetical protein, variant 1 [Aphanomyces invadans]|uniref:C3H1-type domain-containing protein n=1 Tax=Aphanomyces invadans TaxID=157072 RepID=A0A024TBB5_9STRA|nr:hypothetical protein, variant 1 [Aphanomyces invadans]ETV91304.1 hypothetical protein, variant 1 [Aphanomyces invadans]|eukprot:XP_008880141.1 hypothetical protein, variant 1 [Aphanomyces invadans]